MSNMEGKVTRVGVSKPGGERVSIRETVFKFYSCFEPRSLPALARCYPRSFAFYLEIPFLDSCVPET